MNSKDFNNKVLNKKSLNDKSLSDKSLPDAISNKQKLLLYDSHVHFLATGLVAAGLRLEALRSPQDLHLLKVQPSHFRGDWLVGFGWNHEAWSPANFPTAQELDRFFPDFPVAFTRIDGHAVWLNSVAMRKLNLNDHPHGVVRDSKGNPTGVFIDLAKIAIDIFIPPFTAAQKLDFLYVAQKIFEQAGYKAIRDMSGDYDQWMLLQKMDIEKRLSLQVTQNWSCENLRHFYEVLPQIIEARRWERDNPWCRFRSPGVKIYLDGALGSEGAWLSQPYIGNAANQGPAQQGQKSFGGPQWDLAQAEEVLVTAWKQDLEVSVHAIGDEAVDQIVQSALRVVQDSGLRGHLNIEHIELVRTETIDRLAKLPSVTVHMQPSHYLSDRVWLKRKLGDHAALAFRWADLERAGVHIQFGSDSPIEPPDFERLEQGLACAEQDGIPRPQSSARSFSLQPEFSLPTSDFNS